MKKKVKIVIGGTFYGDYFGEVDERPGYFLGKPKGQGTLKTKEGTYVGEVQLGGQPCGKGTFNYLDGSKYTGDFKSGVWSGKGNLTFDDGGYVGEFKKGKPHGFGKDYDANGKVIYEGQYEKGNWHGKGTFLSERGKFVGEFKKNKFYEGELTKNTGEKHIYKEGKVVKNDKVKSKVMKKTWISDDKSQKYVGEFKGEKKHGQGTYTWIGRGEISGIFEEDQFPNYGTFIDYEDHKYIGEMKERNCKYNGKGTLVHFKAKYKYEGEFKDSQKHGYGTFVQEDGLTFKGNWKNGLKHGKGTLVNAVFFRSGEEKGEEFVIDGGPQTGEYKDDLPIGEFYWEMKSGRKYIGELNKDGLFHGKGTLTHPDGKIEKGIWENAKLIKTD